MKLWTHKEFVAHRFPKPVWIVRPLIERGTNVLLHGQPESGKTAFAMTLAEAVATGEPLLGEFACSQGTVVIIELDMGPQEYRHRWQTMLCERTLDLPIHHITTDDPIDVTRTAPYKVLQDAAKLDPTLIIVDALVDTHELDENSSATVKRVYGAFRRLFPNAARCFIHHDHKEPTGVGAITRTKMQQSRGSIAWQGSSSTSLQFVRPAKSAEWRTRLHFSKARNTPPWARRDLVLGLDEETMTLEIAEPTLEQHARAYMSKAWPDVRKLEVERHLQGISANGGAPTRSIAREIVEKVFAEMEGAKARKSLRHKTSRAFDASKPAEMESNADDATS